MWLRRFTKGLAVPHVHITKQGYKREKTLVNQNQLLVVEKLPQAKY